MNQYRHGNIPVEREENLAVNPILGIVDPTAPVLVGGSQPVGADDDDARARGGELALEPIGERLTDERAGRVEEHGRAPQRLPQSRGQRDRVGRAVCASIADEYRAHAM
jgi:hypothetical protein